MEKSTDVPHAYQGPTGTAENARLDYQHNALLSLMHGKLLHAQLHSSPTRILDIGCGSGIVTLELARIFPSAEVIGIDIGPIPQEAPPANVNFIQGAFRDLVSTGTLQASSFDYIFSRMMIAGIVDWQSHTSLVFSLLGPNGVYEAQDMSWAGRDANENALKDQPAVLEAITSTAAAKGMDMFCGETHPNYFEAAGFKDLKHAEYPWALQYWPERPESQQLAQMMQGGAMQAFADSLVGKLLGNSGKYTEDQLETFRVELVRSLEEAKPGDHHTYGITWGVKPV